MVSRSAMKRLRSDGSGSVKTAENLSLKVACQRQLKAVVEPRCGERPALIAFHDEQPSGRALVQAWLQITIVG